MRKALGILLLGVVVLTSCTKDFVTSQAETELKNDIAEIQAYLDANNLDYNSDSNTGIFWKITHENPAGEEPNALNVVYVAWTISTLDGTELLKVSAEDSSFFSYNNANSIFKGFVLSLNTLKEGEKGTFFIPSPYAFGENPPTNFTALKPWAPIRLDMEVIQMYSEDEFISLFAFRNGLGTPEITDSGVRIFRASDMRPQTDSLKTGDNISVKYKGYFLDKAKTVFDEGEFDYILGSSGVIPGFEDALLQMRVGEKVTVLIPSKIAYGAKGSGSIPPNTPLAFDLEVVSKN